MTEEPLLRLDEVGLTYRRGSRNVRALDSVSLSLYPGELAGVWGPRGSGKSSLVNVAAGVIRPTDGAVLLDGVPLSGDRRGVLHAQIGLATRRRPALAHLPIRDWIASALLTSHRYPDALHRARLALDRAGVGDLGGFSWEELSDGERMLAAIAHAIVRGPRVLIVDDPVAGVGGSQRDEVMALLRSIATLGVAVLMTAAELIELRGVDRIWRLREGRLEGSTVRPGGTVVKLRHQALGDDR